MNSNIVRMVAALLKKRKLLIIHHLQESVYHNILQTGRGKKFFLDDKLIRNGSFRVLRQLPNDWFDQIFEIPGEFKTE